MMNKENEVDLLRSIDPGVRRLVRLLREAGFETTDSGDGVSKKDMGCALDYPHVIIMSDVDRVRDECARLVELLIHAGVKFGMTEEDFQAIQDGKRIRMPFVQATYSPFDDNMLIEVSNINDSMLSLSVFNKEG